MEELNSSPAFKVLLTELGGLNNEEQVDLDIYADTREDERDTVIIDARDLWYARL